MKKVHVSHGRASWRRCESDNARASSYSISFSSAWSRKTCVLWILCLLVPGCSAQHSQLLQQVPPQQNQLLPRQQPGQAFQHRGQQQQLVNHAGAGHSQWIPPAISKHQNAMQGRTFHNAMPPQWHQQQQQGRGAAQNHQRAGQQMSPARPSNPHQQQWPGQHHPSNMHAVNGQAQVPGRRPNLHFSPIRRPSGFGADPSQVQHTFVSQPVPGVPFALPDRELITQKLPVGGHADYTFKVALGGNVSITVMPCHSQVAWNITYVQARIFSHPIYPTGRRRRHVDGAERSRKKRCCVTAGVTHNFNFNIAGLNAGLGTSLGDGAITYFKEDSSGGLYEVNLTNTGRHTATYQIFATLRPAISPYVQLPGDPQIKVTAIQHNRLIVHWLPAHARPWPRRDVTYCVEYHREDTAHPSDTQGSQCSFHRMRPTSQSAGCSQEVNRVLPNLQPDTMYKINVYAKNLISNTETAYLGAKVRTATVPIRMASSAEMTNVLAPLGSAVYQLNVDRSQAMKVMVSPCHDQVSWGILDSQGRPVQTFSPTYDSSSRLSGAAGQVSGQRRLGMLASALNSMQPGQLGQSSYRRGTLSLPDMEFMSTAQQSSTIGVVVKNHARRPAKFELYATSTGHNGFYPELPSNKLVRVLRTTPSLIEIAWDRVAYGKNITYCIQYYPSPQSQANSVVHSTCNYKELERKNQYQPGACGGHTRRQLTNVQPSTWYDVDVVAKNVHTQKIKAYSSVRAYTSFHTGAAPRGQTHLGGAMLLALSLLLVALCSA